MEKYEERLRKGGRLCGKELIDTLFGTGGNHAVTAFPLKAVCRLAGSKSKTSVSNGTAEGSDIRMLVGVPKRYPKRAVKRNRAERQIHGAYRRRKSLITLRVNE